MKESGITAAHVADFLEQGLLGELVTLFRSAPGLYALLGDLVRDERIGVRLGASALVEDLAEVDPGGRARAAEALAPCLAEADAVRRGDAAYLLGVVGGARELPVLETLAETDPNADVRAIAREAASAITSRGG